jgi:KUP system potassium uptake protein
MDKAAPKTPQSEPSSTSLAAMSLSALGIVFGDIGTSPLYTLKPVLDLTGDPPRPDVVLGVLSLIIWTLSHHHVGEICDNDLRDEHRQ